MEEDVPCGDTMYNNGRSGEYCRPLPLFQTHSVFSSCPGPEKMREKHLTPVVHEVREESKDGDRASATGDLEAVKEDLQSDDLECRGNST